MAETTENVWRDQLNMGKINKTGNYLFGKNNYMKYSRRK